MQALSMMPASMPITPPPQWIPYNFLQGRLLCSLQCELSRGSKAKHTKAELQLGWLFSNISRIHTILKRVHTQLHTFLAFQTISLVTATSLLFPKQELTTTVQTFLFREEKRISCP